MWSPLVACSSSCAPCSLVAFVCPWSWFYCCRFYCSTSPFLLLLLLLRLLEICINVYIVAGVCCCIFVGLFTFLISMFVVILNSTIICKQVCLLHCFVFVALVYNFNVKQWKSKTPASWVFIFVAIFRIFRLQKKKKNKYWTKWSTRKANFLSIQWIPQCFTLLAYLKIITSINLTFNRISDILYLYFK